MIAEFMFELGLKRHPSIETVLGLAGSQDTDKCGKALKYFVDNRRSLYASYDANAFKHVSFVPAVKPDGTAFFTNPIAVRDSIGIIKSVSHKSLDIFKPRVCCYGI